MRQKLKCCASGTTGSVKWTAPLCSTVLMATPEEPKQDVASHSTIEGGEVSAFRLAGPRLRLNALQTQPS